MAKPEALTNLEVLQRHLEGESPESIAQSAGVSIDVVRALISDDPPRAKEPAPKPARQVDPARAYQRMRIPRVSRAIDLPGARRSAEHPDIQAYLDRTGAKVVR